MASETFGILAEIAVTLTGFIGVVVVLKSRDHPFSRLGLVTIFGTSFGAVLFSFVPELLSHDLSPEATWRWSAGAFGLYHLYLIGYHQYHQRSIRSNSPSQLLIVILSFGVVGLKLAVGLGFLMDHAYEIYFLGLLWLIGIAGYLFLLILFDDSARLGSPGRSSG